MEQYTTIVAFLSFRVVVTFLLSNLSNPTLMAFSIWLTLNSLISMASSKTKFSFDWSAATLM